MDEKRYFHIRQQLEQQLCNTYGIVFHAAVFSVTPFILVAIAAVLTNFKLHSSAWFTSVIWNFVLFAHSTFTFVRSGASTRTRERTIRERVEFETALSGQEKRELHEELSSYIQRRTAAIPNTTAAVLLLTIFWLWSWIVVPSLAGRPTEGLQIYFGVSAVVSLLVGLWLPIMQIRHERRMAQEDIEQGYGEKRKRERDAHFAGVGDDGELILEREDDLPRKHSNNGT